MLHHIYWDQMEVEVKKNDAVSYPYQYIVSGVPLGHKIPSRDRTLRGPAPKDNDDDIELNIHLKKNAKTQRLSTRKMEIKILRLYQVSSKSCGFTQQCKSLSRKSNLFKKCDITQMPDDACSVSDMIYRLYASLAYGQQRDDFYYNNSTKYCMHHQWDSFAGISINSCAALLFYCMNHRNMQTSQNILQVYYLCYCQHFVICKLCVIKLYAITNGFKLIFDVFNSTPMNIYLSNPYPLILQIRFLNVLLNYRSMMKYLFRKKYLFRRLFRFWRKYINLYLKCKNNKNIHFVQCFKELLVANVTKGDYVKNAVFNKSIIIINCEQQRNLSDEFILQLSHTLLMNFIHKSGEYWTKSVYKCLLNHKYFMKFLCSLPIYEQLQYWNEDYYHMISFILLENYLDKKTNIGLKYLCNNDVMFEKIVNGNDTTKKNRLIQHEKKIHELKCKLFQGNIDDITGASVVGSYTQCFSAQCTKIKVNKCKFYKCKGCKVSIYCSVKCQKFDWNLFGHRNLCSVLRKCGKY
eukprot:414734_1